MQIITIHKITSKAFERLSMANESRVWHVRGGEAWSDGQIVRVPAEFAFRPAGDAELNWRVKQAARQVAERATTTDTLCVNASNPCL
jgi:hypothetical protein